MNKDRILETLKKDVRSLLIASKLGLSVQELERDYRMMIGSPLPVKTLDYRSTMELLQDMPDVVNFYTKVDGSVVLSAVVNEETKSMAELVSRQRSNCKKKGVYKRRVTRALSHIDLVRRSRVAPVLPASVKSELRDLLSISSLLVSQLESAYYKRFGRSFQYTRYGFYSLIEVLRSVSDFVQVQQTRAGSLLILKTPVISRTYSIPQSSNYGVKGTSSVLVNGEQNAPKKPPVVDVPPPPAAPQTVGVTALDKLFMEAKEQYFANQQSAKGPSAEKMDEVDYSHVRSENSENILPSSALPSSAVQDIGNKPVHVPGYHIENGTGSPGLVTANMAADVTERRTDGSLRGLEEQFTKDLKVSLSQTRAGFVIGSDLRQDIKDVVRKHPEGLPVSHLPAAFKQYTGKDLPYHTMGFMSVLDLIGSLGDMLYLEDAKDGHNWRLYDIELKRKENVDGERIDEKQLGGDDTISRWNCFTEKSERLKPPVIISSANIQNLWAPVDEPLLASQQEIPPDAVRRQKLCSLSRMKRGFMIGVYMENVTSPSNFYIRCYSKDTSRKLENMMIEMRFCYSNTNVSSRYIVPDKYVTVGEIFALRVDGDVWWYRVIVHAVISSEEVQVFYPDFGTLATVKRCWLRFLKSCYMRLPAQAVPSALAFLKPVGDQWSVEAIKMFQNQCARGPLVAVVLQYVLDQMCLFLCDTSTDEDVYLHQVLIDRGLACLAEEPKFYKTCNPFVRYLIQPSEQPQEVSEDPTGQESYTAESPEVHVQEPVLHTSVTEEAQPEVPYLEAFPIGEDVWDERWSFPGSTASLTDTSKPPSKNAAKSQKEEPKPEQLNVCTKRPDGEFVSQPLEEFYISLIESRNTLEKSAVLSPPLRNCEEFEKTAPAAADLHDYSIPLTPEEESLRPSEDNGLRPTDSSDNQTAPECNPSTGFKKFQIPRRSATLALGPAARLAAAPGSLLHWFAEP